MQTTTTTYAPMTIVDHAKDIVVTAYESTLVRLLVAATALGGAPFYFLCMAKGMVDAARGGY